MFHRLASLTSVVLAVTAIFLAGCTSTPGSFAVDDGQLGNEPFLADGSPDASDWAQPTIDSFAVEPAVLPAGGGTVEVSWTALHSAGCALRVDDQTIALGASGDRDVEVAASTEFRLICLDGDQGEAQEASRFVTVSRRADEDLPTKGVGDFGDFG